MKAPNAYRVTRATRGPSSRVPYVPRFPPGIISENLP